MSGPHHTNDTATVTNTHGRKSGKGVLNQSALNASLEHRVDQGEEPQDATSTPSVIKIAPTARPTRSSLVTGTSEVSAGVRPSGFSPL